MLVAFSPGLVGEDTDDLVQRDAVLRRRARVRHPPQGRDTVEVAVEGIGYLRNTVTAASNSVDTRGRQEGSSDGFR
jgi:hypothetical protein